MTPTTDTRAAHTASDAKREPNGCANGQPNARHAPSKPPRRWMHSQALSPWDSQSCAGTTHKHAPNATATAS